MLIADPPASNSCANSSNSGSPLYTLNNSFEPGIVKWLCCCSCYLSQIGLFYVICSAVFGKGWLEICIFGFRVV